MLETYDPPLPSSKGPYYDMILLGLKHSVLA